MNRFNLTFTGEILPDRDPERVKAGFGKLFAIEDPDRLEQFFSGRPIILRRNLERKAAAEYFARLRKLGVQAHLVTVTGHNAPANDAAPPAPAGQRWAVSSRTPADREAQRLAMAEKAARRRARRQEAAERRSAERAARKRARREEAEHRAAEKAARREAEQSEQRRIAAERAAQEQALREEAERRAAEECARRAAEEAARREAARAAAAARAQEREEKLRAVEQAARERAEKKTSKRREAKNAARLKARERRRRRQEQARQQARQRARQRAREQTLSAEQAAERTLMEEQVIRRAASALAIPGPPKPAAARNAVAIAPLLRVRNVRAAAPRAPRQPGAPNFYHLRAFRNTPAVRARAEVAHRRRRSAFALSAIALACLCLLGGRYLGLPPQRPVTAAASLAVEPGSGPLLLAGDRLLRHDRSGLGTAAVTLASLGLDSLQPPLAFDAQGSLLGVGRPAGAGTAAGQLVRCDLDAGGCRLFSGALAQSHVSGLAVHPLDGTLFVADAVAGELLKLDSGGQLLARAPAPLPPQPVIRLESGLMFVNSAHGNAVSVFRYEEGAFGRQLDEILLLPPAALESGQSEVRDFAWSGENWWVAMHNPESGSAGLYRFDAQWNQIGQAALAPATRPDQLTRWGARILVRDERQLAIQRFGAQGQQEAPLLSNLLQELVAGQQRSARRAELAWRWSLLLCAALSLIGLLLGLLHHLRYIVYRERRERGADPVDDLAEAIGWVDPVAERAEALRQIGQRYAVLAVALLLLALGLGVSPAGLGALLLVLSGPAVTLALLQRSPVGHIGILQKSLLLADHRGVYHMGAGTRIRHRGSFLAIDDVVVFSGNALLPAFSPQQIAARVQPVAAGGVAMDRSTLLVKLLQSRHPLAQGAIATLAALTAALVLLGLQAAW